MNFPLQVKITDVSPEVLEIFIKYLYTATLPVSMDSNNSVSLIDISDKYNVPHVKMEAADILLRSMEVSNAAEILVVGCRHNIAQLKDTALEFVTQYLDQVMNTPGWDILVTEFPEVVGHQLMRRVTDKIRYSKRNCLIDKEVNDDEGEEEAPNVITVGGLQILQGDLSSRVELIGNTVATETPRIKRQVQHLSP